MSQRKRKNTDHGEGSRRQRGEHVVASPSVDVDERDLDESVRFMRIATDRNSTHLKWYVDEFWFISPLMPIWPRLFPVDA